MKNHLEQKLGHIISRMQADAATDAPADVLKYTKNLFRTRAVEPKVSAVRRVLAMMKMDLAPNRAAFGERSAAGAQARQMLFDTGDNAIDLRVTVAAGGFDIRGQVLGGGFGTGMVELSGGGVSVETEVDELGGFSFNGLAAGEYSLVLSNGTDEIAIEQLTIG